MKDFKFKEIIETIKTMVETDPAELSFGFLPALAANACTYDKNNTKKNPGKECQIPGCQFPIWIKSLNITNDEKNIRNIKILTHPNSSTLMKAAIAASTNGQPQTLEKLQTCMTEFGNVCGCSTTMNNLIQTIKQNISFKKDHDNA